jgi:pyridoxine/pyridoxamine 5'-phosphate oxidase
VLGFRSRTESLVRLAQLVRKLRGRESRARFWTGCRVSPNAIEFWTHRKHRLHGL